MSNINPVIPTGGITKMVHSSEPGATVEENLYSQDKSSLNKESYQTLGTNRTVPTHTSEKVNPFNVKGVPGCKECRGSGWKEGRHPHPCNECAKMTVPIIDTHLTKVGQVSQPILEATTIHTVPITTTTTQHIPQQGQVLTGNALIGQLIIFLLKDKPL